MKVYGAADTARVTVYSHMTRPITIRIGPFKISASIAESRILARDLADAATEAERAAAHE